MTADPSPVAPARAVAPVIAVAPRKLRRLKPCFSVSGAAFLFWSLSFIRLAPIKDVFNRTSVLLAFRSSDPVAQPESCRGLLVPACSAGASSFSQPGARSEEHTSELQSRENLVCRLLLEKKKQDI